MLVELHMVKELGRLLPQSGVEPPREFCHESLNSGNSVDLLPTEVIRGYPSVDSNSNILPQINPGAQTAAIHTLNLTDSFLTAYEGCSAYPYLLPILLIEVYLLPVCYSGHQLRAKTIFIVKMLN